MEENKARINCPTFQKQELIIKAITERVNIQGMQEKARNTFELQKRIDVLFSCSDYNGKNLDCKNCRFITALRKKTVDSVIKAKESA